MSCPSSIRHWDDAAGVLRHSHALCDWMCVLLCVCRVEHVDHASMSGVVAAKNMLGAGGTPLSQNNGLALTNSLSLTHSLSHSLAHAAVYDYQPVEFGAVAGLAWEGVGTLDARLETVSVWEEPPATEAQPDLFRRGVVYYLDDDRSVVGVLTVNLPDKMDYAKRLVQYGVSYDNAQDTLQWIYLGQ